MVSSSIRAAKHTPEAVCSCVPCAQWCWSLLRQISRYTFKLHFQLWGNNMILYSELKGKSSAYKAVKEQWWWFKGIVHSELKSLSSFTHAVPKLSFQTSLYTVEHIKRYFIFQFFHAMEVNGVQRCLVPKVLRIIFFCVPQNTKSYRLETTFCVSTTVWVNDRIFIWVGVVILHKLNAAT